MNEYTFTIPTIPPSYNKQFKINFRQRKVYLDHAAKQFVYLAKLSTPNMEVTEGCVYKLSIEYHSNWFFKNGKVKKQDIQNMDKLLIDAVFEKMGVDDSRVWEVHLYKVQSTKVYTKVNIKELECHNSESMVEKSS